MFLLIVYTITISWVRINMLTETIFGFTKQIHLPGFAILLRCLPHGHGVAQRFVERAEILDEHQGDIRHHLFQAPQTV